MFRTTRLYFKNNKLHYLSLLNNHRYALLFYFLIFTSFSQIIDIHRSRVQAEINHRTVQSENSHKVTYTTNIHLKKSNINKASSVNPSSVTTDKTIINVPGDFQTIQAAIDSAVDGSTIMVRTGVYNETLRIIDKSIVLTGDDKENTIINGQNSNDFPTIFANGGDIDMSGFLIKNGIDGITLLNSSNFTINNNIIEMNLNIGVHCIKSTGSIINNVIKNNRPYRGERGRGIQMEESNVIIDGNTIIKNSESGMFLSETNATIKENLVAKNSGIGLAIRDNSKADIVSNTVQKNIQGGFFVRDSTFSVRDNIIKDNLATGIEIVDCSDIKIMDNVFEKNGKLSNFIAAITVFETNRATISNNDINLNNVGIIISDSVSVDINSNNFDRNDIASIQLISSEDITVTSNTITGTVNSERNLRGGIAIKESSSTINKNNIKRNESDGIRIVDTSSIVEIIDNSITDNSDNGILCILDLIISGCCNEVISNGTNINGCPSSITECPCLSITADSNSISILPQSILLTHIGANVKLSAILQSEMNGTLNITNKAIWVSSDVKIASVDTNGIITANDNGTAMICANFENAEGCTEVTINTINAGINQWVTSSESVALGEVNDIVIDISDINIIYAATNTGNIFKSIDNGVNWENKSDGLLNDSLFVIGVDPLNAQVLYAGGTQKIYKTVNAAESWEVIKSDVFVTSLVIDNINPDIIYAGTSGSGILKSTDGGKNWKRINKGLPYKYIREDSLVIDPSDPEILYVAVETNNKTGKGIFKTTDGGNNWKGVNNGLFKETQGLAINPKNSQILYAGTFSGGVFKTTNGGESWSRLENSPHDINRILTIDNINPNVIYLGNFSTGIFMSRDSGLSWKRINTQLTDRTIRALKTDSVSSSTLYTGTFNGVFRFTHAFKEFEAIPNPNGTAIDIRYQFNNETNIEPIGFNIYRSSSTDGDFEKIVDEPINLEINNFTDTDFLEGATHVYKMAVVTKESETLRSFSTSATPLLAFSPDFTVTTVENKKETIRGAEVSYPINILSNDNFTNEIFLEVDNLPENVNFEFFKTSGVPPFATTLKLFAEESAPIGEFPVRVTATTGQKARSDNIILKVVSEGSSESTLTQIINKIEDTVKVGNILEITGEIIPQQINRKVVTTFVLPDGSESKEESFTNEDGRYSIVRAINKSGLWKISSSWNGNTDLSGSSSDLMDIFVSPVTTSITLVTNANSSTERGDIISLTGKISPSPESGKVFLEIDNIDGSINFNSFIPISKEGEFTHQFRVSGAEQGEIRIIARFDGTKDFTGNEKELLIPIGKPLGMAIIVAGGGNSPANILWNATNGISGYVYQVIKALGIPDNVNLEEQTNRIFYLHPDANNDVDEDGIPDTDALPTTINLQKAIEDWALNLINTDNELSTVTTPLTIYMIGPGEKEIFNINENEVIRSTDLDLWLDNLFINLQRKHPLNPPKRFPVNIIIESPQAGSFIDDLKIERNGVGLGRIVITSTDECKTNNEECNTGKTNISGDGLTSFSGKFFYGIKVGKSITTSWSEANITTREIFDNQNPQIDDNGDGIPNEIDDGIEGSLTFIGQNRFIGNIPEIDELSRIETNISPFLNEAINDPLFIVDQRPTILGIQENLVLRNTKSVTLWAIVIDPDNNLKDVQALIFPPKSTTPEQLTLQFSESNNRYEVQFNGVDIFGLYKTLIIATDKFNNTSLTAKTVINAQNFGTADLRGKVFNNNTNEPLNGARITVDGFLATDTTNRNGDYSLPLNAGVHTIRFTKEGFQSKTLKDVNIRSTSPPVNIGLTPLSSIIKGNVTDKEGNVIPFALVKITNNVDVTRTATDIKGNYVSKSLQADSYKVSVRKRRFSDEEQIVELSEGQELELNFQMNKRKTTVTVTNSAN